MPISEALGPIEEARAQPKPDRANVPDEFLMVPE
jgi:hypothetical protein